MKTDIHFVSYLADFFLELNILSDTLCRENQNTNFVFSNFFFLFFRKSCRLGANVEIYCRAGQATDDIMAHARIACWIPKATNIHLEYVILNCFSATTNGCTNAPQRYVLHTRTLTDLFFHFHNVKAHTVSRSTRD
jgi:hypothetical protein